MHDEIGAKADSRQTALFVADLATGLREVSSKAGLPFLSYLLEMVIVEALTESERK